MAKTIAVAIQKGGTGKTSTAVNLATGLKAKNQRVLLVDMDSQANASISLSAPTEKSLINCLVDKLPIRDIIVETKYCDIVPSNLEMSNFETKILDLSKVAPDRFLLNQLKSEQDNYDYIIIDCPPALNFQTINCLASADSVLIVLEANEFSLTGLTQFLSIYEQVNNAYDVKIEGLLLNKVNKQTTEFKDISKQLNSMFPNLVYDFFVPVDQKIPKSQRWENFKNNKAIPCIEAFPSTLASLAYKKLVDEVSERRN